MLIILNIDYDALMLLSSCFFSIFAVFARHNDDTLWQESLCGNYYMTVAKSQIIPFLKKKKKQKK